MASIPLPITHMEFHPKLDTINVEVCKDTYYAHTKEVAASHLELFCRSIKMAKTELSHVNKHVFQKLNMYCDIHIFDTNRK